MDKNKNVFERRAEELQKYKRKDESIFPEYPEEGRVRSSKKAPYIAIAWLEKFLDLNRRQRIDKVDAEFVRLNIMGSGNESKIISALQFLGLIDEYGSVTSRLASLRVMGDEFKKNLASTVKEAYTDLISTIVLDVAKSENLVNFFVQRYNYSYSMARSAARLFVWLATQAEIPISEELQNLGTESYPQVRQKPPKTEPFASRPKHQKISEVLSSKSETTIQATVNINLDKDTPRELWDRVLALLGEKRKQEDLETKQ